MKGQILIENGRIEEATDAYRKAIQFSSRRDGLLHLKVALLLLQTYQPELLDQVIEHLRFARSDRHVPERSLWHLFSIAYGRQGARGLFYYAQAEEFLILGNKERAFSLAKRAEQLLPPGSVEWVRTRDILSLGAR